VGQYSICWNEVWSLFIKYGPALSRIGNTLASQNRRLPPDEISDLLHAFVLERLPRIALLTQDMAPEDQGRYVRTSFRNFLRNVARTSIRHEKSLEQLATELKSTKIVQDDWDDRKRGTLSDQTATDFREKFTDALCELSAEQAQAVAMFLGTDNDPRSVREIAKELRTTRYAAKRAILDGLLGVALVLGRRGVLDDREVEACQLIILEGHSITDTARALRLTQHQVRFALERARSVVASALQKR
jgi:DNA-directed RNA polymerase specialized sigma24 family protein